MLKISIIISTKNEERVIGDLLTSIKKQSLKDFETIVVDNNSTDATKVIAKKYGSLVFNKGPERSTQRNYGVAKSRSQYVVILDADMVLTKNVLKDCVAKLDKNKDLGALVIPEKSFGIGFWTKFKVFEREFYVGEESIEAARCFRRDLFMKYGGYDEGITGPEDCDLPLRMKKNGVKIGRIGSYILHNEGNFSPLKSAKKKFYYASRALKYVKKHPEKIVSQGNLLLRWVFFKKWKKIISHPALSAGMFLVKGIEMTGALFGAIYSVIMRKR